jgi:hypothetical protein
MSFLLFALSLVQTQAPSTAARAADKFALDLPADETVTAPAEPSAEPSAEPAPAGVSAEPVPAVGGYTLDTPIADLIADPRAKAVLDADVPGLSEDENLPKFKALSLRKLAPLSGGQMTAKLLAKVEGDLAAIEGAPPPVKKVESRRALPSGR